MKTHSRKRELFWYIFFGVIYLLGVSVFTVCTWYSLTFDLEFKELLYTLASPLKGTGQSTLALIFGVCLPIVLVLSGLYVLVVWLIKRKGRELSRLQKGIWASACSLLLCASLVFSVFALRIPGYVEALSQKTTIYEEWYVDPESVAITANGKPKNLIYIYLESMETTYASLTDGGAQHTNYMPNLTRLANEHTSFSDKETGIGGFHSPSGTGWTMSALLATTSGIPFSFPVGENGHNSMKNRETFAAQLTTLGDILAQKGYTQEFLCGSDATFGGRRDYFEQHGDYQIFDLFTAREKGYIAPDYYQWWGYEDKILFEIAKDEVTRLALSGKPFNFTMLTVDAHHNNGYICSACNAQYSNRLANVVNCTDRQVTEFVEWCMAQDFFRDTVIVLTGDHPRMDKSLVAETDFYDRTVYNCFIGAAVTPKGETVQRVMTPFDIFPTTLAAMGFAIEGERLGLGVNLFSEQQTLSERLGYSYLEAEINKFSEYYIKEFN